MIGDMISDRIGLLLFSQGTLCLAAGLAASHELDVPDNARGREVSEQAPGISRDVEELRRQMRELRQQMRRVQKILEQIVQRSQTDDTAAPADRVREFKTH